MLSDYLYFKENMGSLWEQYADRYLLISGAKVLGDFITLEDACLAAKPLEHGTYIIDRCKDPAIEREENYVNGIIYYEHVKQPVVD